MFKKISVIIFIILIVLHVNVPAYTVYGEEQLLSDEQIKYYQDLNLQGTTLNVYNWGEYISDGSEGSVDVVKLFEKITGIKVNYSNFESNENLYSKILGGGVSYDVVVPSDYTVERMIDEDMLLKIDMNNVPNFKYVRDDCKNMYYDPNNEYSVTYNFGTTILIYNKKLVSEKPTSWKVMWDKKYKDKVLMFNNPRDAFAIAQFVLGQSLNNYNESEWTEAAEYLAKQKDDVNPVYVMDEVFNLMESGEYAFAAYYAGDYILMNENNPDLGYCFPEEGVNVFTDAFCIPKCAQNKRGAEAFINFMQEPEIALENQEFIYYASSNKVVMNNKDNSLYGNEVVYPSNTLKSEPFKNLPQNILELENNLWGNVKSGNLSKESENTKRLIYIQSGVISFVAIFSVIISLLRKNKKRREEDLSEFYK